MVEKLTELFEQARTTHANDSNHILAPNRHPVRDFTIRTTQQLD